MAIPIEASCPEQDDPKPEIADELDCLSARNIQEADLLFRASAALRQRGAGEVSQSDFRWLIEAPGQRYLAARKVGCHEFHWTQDHNAALAFRCEAQADMTMMAIRQLSPALFDFERTIGNAKAVEHAWIDGKPPFEINELWTEREGYSVQDRKPKYP